MIFALWVIGGVQSVPGFHEQVVLKEFAGRFGETIHRPQPLYFYLPHLLQKFAPWSLLSLGLAVGAWRSREKISPETFWLLVWSLGGLVVMSLLFLRSESIAFSQLSAALFPGRDTSATCATMGGDLANRRCTFHECLRGRENF